MLLLTVLFAQLGLTVSPGAVFAIALIIVTAVLALIMLGSNGRRRR